MSRSNARRALGAAGVLAIVALGVLGWLAAGALAVGVGHKAKTVCSGVFVSGRDTAAVLSELQTDDLAILRYISASIDVGSQAVTARAIGLERRAVHRAGLGCALVLDGLTPPAMPSNGDETLAPELLSRQSLVEHPMLDGLSAVVARAFAEPNPQRPRRTQAVLIIHRGAIVAERYAGGIGPNTPLAGWSMTKSVMNALVGILVGQGRLSLEGAAPIPEWQQAGDPRSAITLDHLLRMSSGLRFEDGMSSPRSDVMRMLFGAGDAAAFAANSDLAHAPGTRWQYASGTTNILARIMRTVLGDEVAYLKFPRRALFNRIGMWSAVLETDAGGTFLGSSYMYATARDWARLGILYVQDGVWEGQGVLPEGWVAYSITPAPADPTGRYGAHFWLQVPEEYGGGELSVPAFHAAGHEGQFVTIVPSHGLVIVRLGRTRFAHSWDHRAFVEDVLAAMPPEASYNNARRTPVELATMRR